jgi:alkylation response protein AidB-like acyl-CoA dehydrogenase
VTVSPILLLNGQHHFNEVRFEDVFVPNEMVLGEVGSGWHQVTSELAFERSGPDRFLSALPLLVLFMKVYGPTLREHGFEREIGRLFAKFWVLHNMSLSIARSLDAGKVPALEAALTKDIGTKFEQHVVQVIRNMVSRCSPSCDGESSAAFEQLLVEATITAPTFTLRGGTNEVLRMLAAKQLQRAWGVSA